jgi:hypothetical protein
MTKILRSADMLVNMVELDPELLDVDKNKRLPVLRKLAASATKNLPPPPLVREAGIFYIVVITLGLVALGAIGGAIWVTVINSATQIPETITALGAAAIGALAGLLANPPANK